MPAAHRSAVLQKVYLMANPGLVRVNLSSTDLPDLLLPGECGGANIVLYPITHSVGLCPQPELCPQSSEQNTWWGWGSQGQSQAASPCFLPSEPCSGVHCGQSILRAGGSGPWKSKESLVENSSFGETHSHPALVESAMCKSVLGAWFRISAGCWGDAGRASVVRVP